jgi:hypothetical protein
MRANERLERLERAEGWGDRCPASHLVGVRFLNPPTAKELAALAPTRRPPDEACPRCGRPALKVIVLDDLGAWLQV